MKHRILLVPFLFLTVGANAAERVTTTPLQFYGLGTLNCAAWSPDGTKIVTGGSAGAFLWDAATSRVVRMFIGHEKEVTSVVFSPDGKTVLTGSRDASARLWNVADGTAIRTFSHALAVNSVAFSPDGTKVLTGSSDRTARLWNANTGALVKTFIGHFNDILSVALSPDGTKVLTGSKDNTARLWNATTGGSIRTLSCASSVICVAFSPDGMKILTGAATSATLWNSGDGNRLWSASSTGTVSSIAFSSHTERVLIGTSDGRIVSRVAASGAEISVVVAGNGPVTSLVLSPDERYLLTAIGPPQNGPKIWTVSDVIPMRTFSGHTNGVAGVAFSPDGTEVLTGSYDYTAKLWNGETASLLRTFSGHANGVACVAFSPDGTKVLTGSGDWTAKLWDASNGSLLRTFSGHTGWVNSVAFSPDGIEVLTGSSDATAKLWDASNGSEIRTFSGHTYGLVCAAFSPDGTKVLTASWWPENSVKLWGASSGALLRTFSGHTASLRSAAFSPDGTKVLTGSADTTAKLWEASNCSEIRTFSGHADIVNSVAFSPDGTAVLTGSADTTAKLWNASNGTVLRTFSGHTDIVNSVAFSPDGMTVLTGSWDRTARLWAFDPTDVRRLSGHTLSVMAVAVSADLRTVATANQGTTVTLWNAADGALVRAISGHTGAVGCLALSSSGTLLLSGSDDQTAKLWNTTNGQLLHTYTGHGGQINSVALSSDTSRILTASDDGMAILWDTTSETLLMTFSGHGGPVYAAAISADATRAVTGGGDNTAKIWNAATGMLLKTLSGHAGDVRFVALSSDKARILTGSDDGTARLWDSNGGLIQIFAPHSDRVVAVGFSPDGNQIMTADGDAARLWNVQTATVVRRIEGHTQAITGAVLSADGTRIVTGSEDGTARLWPGVSETPTGPAGDKFIIVSGGGNFMGNPIVSQTQALADRAFFTCLVRGYKRDEIRYLSAFGDWQTRDSNGDGLPDADSSASLANFWSAIDNWSSDTARLFIYLIDHGSWNSVTNQWYFRLNQNDYINARDLDAHLDALQAATGCEVILIVDACYSGGFVQECTATSGTRRVVVSSTTPTDLSIYTPPAGAESFSFFFFSFAILGNTIENCYDWTDLAFQAMGNPAGQDPWMDDNNDGISDKWDGALAARHVLGRYPAFGLNAPTITAVASTQTVTLGQTAALWARLSEAVAAKEVWVLVIPEGATYVPGQPVTNLTRVNLAWSAARNRWEATLWPAAQPVGRSTIIYFAMSEDALKTRLLATPVAAGLTILSGGYEARFDAAASAASEGAGTANLLLRLSKPATWAVTLNYSVGGTATPGVDHARLPGNVTFNPGQTTKTLPVVITDDTIDEPNETVVVTLTGAMGAALGATKVHTLTIQDNDPTPTVVFSAPSSAASEGAGTVNLLLNLSNPSASTVTVNYSVGGTATPGIDYTTLPGSTTIAPGRTARYLPVTILDDQEDEPDETVIVTLTSALNATLGATRAATLTIRGNDLPTAILRWPLYR